MKLVVDAGPIILLGKMARLSLLAEPSERVLIPHEVAWEIDAGPAADPARLSLAANGQSLVAKPEPFDLRVVAWDFGKGETAVICQVLSKPGSVCILDDRAARDCARLFGARVKGTVGFLLLAKQEGMIPAVRPVIESLLNSGATLHETVVRDALHLAGES